MRSLREMVSDHRGHGEILDDGADELFTLRQHHAGVWQGAPWEIDLDALTEVRAGRVTRVELFNPDQAELRQARLAELRAVRWEAPLAEYVTVVDRRPDGWGLLRGSVAVLGADRISACRPSRGGNPWDGAPAPRREHGFAVAALNRAGEAAYVELIGEEDAARELYAAYTEDPEAVTSVQFGFAWFGALNRRDRAGARTCLVEDLVVVDHRPASAIEVRGAEAYLEMLWSLMELSDDVRWWYVDAGEPGRIGRASIMIAGHWNAGRGEAEIPVGVVFVLRGDAFERIELYPPRRRTRCDSRVEELRQPARRATPPTPSRPSARARRP